MLRCVLRLQQRMHRVVKQSTPCATGGHAAPSASAYLKAGDAAVSRGEWTAAVRHYSGAIEADGGAVLAFRKRAKAHSGLGDHRAALRDLGTTLDLDPGSVALHLER